MARRCGQPLHLAVVSGRCIWRLRSAGWANREVEPRNGIGSSPLVCWTWESKIVGRWQWFNAFASRERLEMLTLMNLPPHYSGIARLYPLAGKVVFPATWQILDVRDAVSTALIEHALSGDGLLAFAVQQPGYGIDSRSGYRSADPQSLYRMVCLARIVEYETEQQKYQLSALGIRRAWIRREVPTRHPFRMADVQVLEPAADDQLLPLDVEQRVDLRPEQRDQLYRRLQLVEYWKRQLKQTVLEFVPHLLPHVLPVQQLLDQRQSLDTLVDMITAQMRLPLGFQLKQLQTLDPVHRAQRIVGLFAQLRRIATDGFQFPVLPNQRPPSQPNVFPIAQPSSVDQTEPQTEAQLISIDYQSHEFEVAVKHVELQLEQELPEVTAQIDQVLDQTLQEFPGEPTSGDDHQDVELPDPEADGDSKSPKE